MSDITLSVPEDALLALKLTPEQLGNELRLATPEGPNLTPSPCGR